jgi:hypothetical protein
MLILTITFTSCEQEPINTTDEETVYQMCKDAGLDISYDYIYDAMNSPQVMMKKGGQVACFTITDVLLFLSNYPNYNANYDFDNNKILNIADCLYMLNRYGVMCEPPLAIEPYVPNTYYQDIAPQYDILTCANYMTAKNVPFSLEVVAMAYNTTLTPSQLQSECIYKWRVTGQEEIIWTGRKISLGCVSDYLCSGSHYLDVIIEHNGYKYVNDSIGIMAIYAYDIEDCAVDTIDPFFNYDYNNDGIPYDQVNEWPIDSIIDYFCVNCN